MLRRGGAYERAAAIIGWASSQRSYVAGRLWLAGRDPDTVPLRGFLAVFLTIASDNLGDEKTNEVIQTLTGHRGPGVNPTTTDWGTSQAAQRAAARLAGVMGPAQPKAADG